MGVGVRLDKLKSWKLVCPKCSHVEASQESGGTPCGNCGAPAQAFFGWTPDEWESEGARRSWRQLACSKGCGWSVTSINCSQCGAEISGDFIKGGGMGQENGGLCFVATACFEDMDHPTVEHLRAFRDLHLSRYSLGQAFIAWYYKNGSSYADWVSSKPRIKASLRVVFNQLVKVLPRK